MKELIPCRTLVTGGAGFLASHVVDELVQLGHQVTVVDDLSGGFRRNVHPAADFVQGDVADVAVVARLFRQPFDHVFHLAAYAAEGLSHHIRHFNYRNNVLGSINLINAALNAGSVKRFVFTSSIAVYGHGRMPARESDPCVPVDPYGIAKLAVELDLQAALHYHGLPYTIFRPHNIYGERQNLSDPYRNVVGIFMNQILDGRPMTIFGDGTQTRAFSYVGDVAPFIARSVHIPEAINQVFNIGGSVPFTINELAQVVSAAFGRPVRTLHLPERLEVKHVHASHDKFMGVFADSYAPTTLEDGITRMVDWATALQRRPSQPFHQVEVLAQLPDAWKPQVRA